MKKNVTQKDGNVTVPAVYKSTKRRRRKMRRMGSSVPREAIGTLDPGCEIFGLTKGQFSLVELVVWIIEQTGPVDVDIMTWTAAEEDILEVSRLVKDGQITRIRWVIDQSFGTRKPERGLIFRQCFDDDSIRIMRIHAKILAIRNERWDLALRTSMNLNQNPRFENFEISDDPDLCRFIVELVDEIFEKQDPGAMDVKTTESVMQFTAIDMDEDDGAATTGDPFGHRPARLF